MFKDKAYSNNTCTEDNPKESNQNMAY